MLIEFKVLLTLIYLDIYRHEYVLDLFMLIEFQVLLTLIYLDIYQHEYVLDIYKC